MSKISNNSSFIRLLVYIYIYIYIWQSILGNHVNYSKIKEGIDKVITWNSIVSPVGLKIAYVVQ